MPAQLRQSFVRAKESLLSAVRALLWLGLALACQTDTNAPDQPLTREVSVVIESVDGGNGSVVSSPAGIDCPTTCSANLVQPGPGTNIVLTATPAAGAVFLGWGGACSGTGDCVILFQSGPVTVTARFGRQLVELDVTIATFGQDALGEVRVTADLTCIADLPCKRAFPVGTEVTLTAIPVGETSFISWSGACTGGQLQCGVLMDAPKSVTATFARMSGLLTVEIDGEGGGAVVSSPEAIDCPDDSCAARFTNGTSVTLTAFPDPESQFAGWSGTCSGTEPCVLTMGPDASVTATFEPKPEPKPVLTVSVVSTAFSGGSVTSTPAGIDCPSECEAEYEIGAVVTLTATPNPGSVFAGWSGACTGTADCDVTMDGPKTVTAEFGPAPKPVLTVTVTATASSGGRVTSTPPGIDCPDDCAEEFELGAAVTLTASPGDGSVFVGWSGACSGTGTCAVTMDESKQVTATFGPIPPVQLSVTINRLGSSDGLVTSNPEGIDCPIDCTAEFPVGTTVTLTALPVGGSVFVAWGGDCSGSGSCILVMDGAKSVQASFTEAPVSPGILEVRIVDPARNPVVPNHAAIRRNGVWESLPAQSSYMLDVDFKFEVAFRCGGGVRMYKGTIDEVPSLRIECPPTLPSTSFSYTWNFDGLGFGTASSILSGPNGAFDFGSGSSNTKLVAGFPQFPRFDLLFSARRSNLLVGMDIRRDLGLPLTEPLDFSLGSSHAVGSAAVPPFPVPEGILSGSWEMLFGTRRAFMSLGFGSSGGGNHATVPSFLIQPGDKFVFGAGGTGMGGHSVFFARVATLPSADGVQLPRRWIDFVHPQPSRTPVFTDLRFDEDEELDGIGYRFDLTFPSGSKANSFWHVFATRAYVGLEESFTFEPPNLPGFLDLAIESNDFVRYLVYRYAANRLMGDLLVARLISGTPALDGLILKVASVTATFTAP